MINNATNMLSDFWRPVCTIWEQRYKAAQTKKLRFDMIRRQCMAFYHGQAGFMWQEHHKQEFFDGDLPNPKFKITLNKLFEFVELYGPHLFWQYPARKVIRHRSLKLTPDLFGDPNDEQVLMMFQQIVGADTQRQSLDNFANKLMELYLDWSQRESNLVRDAVLCIKEALLSGMGVLWPETYSFPEEDAVYTRLRWGSVANLFVDADCHDPQWETAGYIFRRHIQPAWQVERIFDLPKGSLRQYATHQSAEQAVREESLTDERAGGPKQDMVEWVETWSKVGIGPKVSGVAHEMLDQFDDVVGDYAYIVFIPGCPFLLNAPPDRFFGQEPWNDENVKAAFEWRAPNYGHPFPCWKDNRWPVRPLIFNELMGSPWPIAPAAPGLPYLITLNILVSSYVDQTWFNRRTIVAYLQSAAEEIGDLLKSDEPFVTVGINDNLHQRIGDIIQQLPKIETNKDVLDSIQMMSAGFDRSIGLTELMYGNTGPTQVRIAADIRERSARSSIRPEKMAGDVAEWMSSCSQLEMFLAAFHVTGDSLQHLLGEFGAMFWNDYYGNMDPARVMREMTATVEASEVQRPNSERDTANWQALQQYLMPAYFLFAQQTQDTNPVNELIRKMGEAMQMDVESMLLPPWSPQQDPQMQQLQMATAMAELNKLDADAGKQQAAAQKDMATAMATAVKAGLSDGMAAEGDHIQNLRHAEEDHIQQLRQDEESHRQKLLFDEETMELEQKAAKQRAAQPASNSK